MHTGNNVLQIYNKYVNVGDFALREFTKNCYCIENFAIFVNC